MADYIDREEMLSIFNSHLKIMKCIEKDRCFDFTNLESSIEQLEIVIEIIKSMPTVEQKHGHWIKISPANIFECSVCGHNLLTDEIEMYQFCHMCGAKMDEVIK